MGKARKLKLLRALARSATQGQPEKGLVGVKVKHPDGPPSVHAVIDPHTTRASYKQLKKLNPTGTPRTKIKVTEQIFNKIQKTRANADSRDKK